MITKVSEKCVELVKHYESLHDGDLKKIGLQPKLCPADVVTIGYGHALTDSKGKFLKGAAGIKLCEKMYPQFMTIDEPTACKLLEDDLNEFSEKLVELMVEYNWKLKQEEFDALVSFAFNCGIGAIENSGKLLSVGRMVNNVKRTPEDVNKAFGLWNKGGGKVLKGLVLRRQSEAFLFLTGNVKFFN